MKTFFDFFQCKRTCTKILTNDAEWPGWQTDLLRSNDLADIFPF